MGYYPGNNQPTGFPEPPPAYAAVPGQTQQSPQVQQGYPPQPAQHGYPPQQPQQQYAPPPPPSQPQNPDTRPLGQGWISQYDPSSQRWFYVYTPTAHRQWEHPADRGMGAPPPPPAQQPYGYPYQQPQQQPYYPQQQPYPPQPYPPQPYAQQPYYGGQPQYQQPPVMAGQQRAHGSGGMGMAGTAALGLGAGVLGFMAADAIFDD